MSHRIRVIDTHTGGEPTRVVVEGGPELGEGSLADRRERLCGEHDFFRSAVVCEPRGSDVMVGALLVEPGDDSCAAGAIFFNNVGYLGMCGHGAIGVAAALWHQGRVAPGRHKLETPVGVVPFELDDNGRVTIENVPSYRRHAGAKVEIPRPGADMLPITGDVAWGGNWFFLTEDHGETLTPSRVRELTALSWEIRYALASAGITGEDGAEVDHIELLGPPDDPANHGRAFVLCPGGAYDRSPCGTGTSAKLACLAADGKLQPGEVWRQESIIGSVFEAMYRLDGEGRCLPSISGTAYVTAEASLIIDPRDPLGAGIRP